MATWPSGSKASTTNLDAGTDKPSLARADIKQNVDNVNDIIDMFNISGPTSGQILKYNTDNSRFELATDDTGNDTTYSLSAEQDGTNANLVLTGSDSSLDQIQLVAGDNVTLTVDSAGAVTLAATGTGIANVVEDTTPQLGGDLDVNGSNIVSTNGGNISIVPDTDGDIQLTASGEGMVSVLGDISVSGDLSMDSNTISNVNLKDYKETIYALSYGATITPDVANGNVQEITLTGNVAFGGFNNAEDGQSLTLIIHQDATGSRLFSESLSSNNAMLFAGGDSTLSTDAASTDIMSIIYAGGIYYASLAKGFE
jgi:hypothetical protein